MQQRIRVLTAVLLAAVLAGVGCSDRSTPTDPALHAPSTRPAFDETAPADTTGRSGGSLGSGTRSSSDGSLDSDTGTEPGDSTSYSGGSLGSGT
jgi:hypothetical protein